MLAQHHGYRLSPVGVFTILIGMNEMHRSIVRETHHRERLELTPQPTGIAPNYHHLPDIRAVLFDIYGTLLISGSGDVGTAVKRSRSLPFKKALIDGGIQDPDEAIVEQAERLLFEKIQADHETSRSAGIDFPEVDILSIWKEVLTGLGYRSDEQTVVRIAASYESAVNPVCIMPGSIKSVTGLRDAGFLLGIVSNAQFYTPILLEYELGMNLADAGFDNRLCSFSYIAGAAKPSKAIFKPVLDILYKTRSISPEQVLYVGNDMLNDIYTASIAGCRTCLFAGDQRSLRMRKDHDLITDLSADGVITELSQLLEITTL